MMMPRSLRCCNERGIPFHTILSGLSSHPFQFIIPAHFLVQFLLHPVHEVCAAVALPPFDVSVETVAIF